MSDSRLAKNLRSFVLPLTAAGIVPGVLVVRAPSLPTFTLLRASLAVLVFLAGFGLLAWTVTLFIRVGRGTLAPWDPTQKLVIVGPFAHTRNPMISGVFFMLCGETLFFAIPSLAIWTATFFVINHVYFMLSEEPGLLRRFGADYTQYKNNVPRWLPRRTPWRQA